MLCTYKTLLTGAVQVHKSYRTVVGGLLEGRGFIDIPLDGKPSLTEYRSISQSQSGNHGWVSTLDLCPHTGMTTLHHHCKAHCMLAIAD